MPALINARNRYPGVQFDSESVSYGFSEVSQEVLDEWNWTETFAHGDETLRYARFLTDKFNLRQYMQFNTRVKSARWREESNSWLVTDKSGRTYRYDYPGRGPLTLILIGH